MRTLWLKSLKPKQVTDEHFNAQEILREREHMNTSLLGIFYTL